MPKPIFPLTGTEALRLLREVVAEDPDRVYERHSGDDRGPLCRYVSNGQPDCLIGHVLYRAGWTIPEIDRIDRVGTAFGDRLDPAAVAVLEVARRAQDWRDPWSVALHHAETVASSLGITVLEATGGRR